MAEVVKTILDGDGEPFTMRFWEDDAGNLTPLHRIAPESTVVLSGSSVAQVLDESDATEGVLTFSEDIEYVSIYNTDESNAGVFTINGIDIPVPAGVATERFRISGTASPTVTVATSESYIVTRYE